MKKYKFFILLFISLFVLNFLFHFITWNLYTKKVNPQNETVGDLARMSYHLDIINSRISKIDLKQQHIHFSKFNKDRIDMITIGDSFSNGGGGGLNRYYQDYIATYNNISVLNILQLPGSKNYIESIALLCNSGYLDQLKVKYILIESVQRESIERFAKNNINFNLTTDNNIQNTIKNTYDIYNPKEKDKQQIGIVNNLNFNALKYNIQFYLKGYGKYKSYNIEKLKYDYFSSVKKDELVFFKDDILKLSLETKEKIKILNNNFNKLALILKKKGIKLYFMPAVDKYNLYNDYIISNQYNKSIFFEELRTLDKKYILIDTKDILIKELEKGVKDIYYSDDTHWNYKASEAIFKKVKFE